MPRGKNLFKLAFIAHRDKRSVRAKFPYKDSYVNVAMPVEDWIRFISEDWNLYLNKANKGNPALYLVAQKKGESRQYVHRLVAQPEGDQVVHHMGGTLDNRRSMLRNLSRAEHIRVHQPQKAAADAA